MVCYCHGIWHVDISIDSPHFLSASKIWLKYHWWTFSIICEMVSNASSTLHVLFLDVLLFELGR